LTSTSDNFNLEAPPGFRGLHPDLPVRIYHRHLPHWRQDGAAYFVTFRLADSIPQQHLRALKWWRKQWEEANPEPRSEKQWEALAKEITSRTEAWLDSGYGECVFAHAALAREMSESLLKFQDQRYLTSCFVVMPNHVHLVIKPLGRFELEAILKDTKGYVARKVNATLHRSGTLWEQESYDRIIRDEEHLWQVIQYIGRNPAKAGLAREKWHRWIHPEWQAAKWRFQDD
jgi:REP element-mobilizing transposase RayT